MSARATVRVFDFSTTKPTSSVKLPSVFLAPIRPDVVRTVHTGMSKNRRQPYAVSRYAGEQTSAESWGTGRAVARIPRVAGSGTHRAGQAAFGNMCRGGRMYAPTKVWRRWHQKISVGQRRFALTSALAATAIPALVLARGHRVNKVPELPLVVSSGAESIKKTANAIELLKKFGALPDVIKSKVSKKTRAGKGKARNRRYLIKKGPLVVYEKGDGIVQAFRNIPGVNLVNVTRMNLLQLAPGGHVGRFVIWTEGAFKRLDALFGSFTKKATEKNDYTLSRSMVSVPDLARIINSDEIQNHLRSKRKTVRLPRQKKNPLTNAQARVALNPFAAVAIRQGYRNRLIAKANRAARKAHREAKAAKKQVVKKPTKKGIQKKKFSAKTLEALKKVRESRLKNSKALAQRKAASKRAILARFHS